MNIFHHAAVFGNAEIFNALMVLYYEVIPATRVNTNLPWHHTNYQQNQALHLACIHGHLEIVRLIVENPTTEIKKEQEKEKGKEKEDLYPSHSAIAALNAVDDEGNTPFHLAITHQHGEIAEYLINRGAVTLNQNIKGSTPFQDVNLDFALNDLATIPLEKRIKFFEEVIFFKKNAEQLEELKKIHLQLVSRFRLTDLLVLLFRNGIFTCPRSRKINRPHRTFLS